MICTDMRFYITCSLEQPVPWYWVRLVEELDNQVLINQFRAIYET